MKLALTLSLLLCLSACSGTPTTGPRATVQMRDGSRVSGMVLSSTADELKLAGDDNVTRTIPMSQVRSVVYGEPAASAPSAAAPPAAPRAAAPVATEQRPLATPPTAPTEAPPSAAPAPAASVTPPPAAPPVSTPVAETAPLPRPTLDDVTSDTHVVAAGTELSVQTNETIDGSTAADGQTFDAHLTDSVRDADGKVVIPAGAKAQIVIKSLTQGGKIRGQSDLVLDLAAVSIDGRHRAERDQHDARAHSGDACRSIASHVRDSARRDPNTRDSGRQLHADR